jgi:integrase
MSKPRKTNQHLPKYVRVEYGSYWYRPPEGLNVKIGPEGQEHLVWKFMLEHSTPPPTTGSTLNDFFERYKREILPTLAPRTQKDYARHIAKLGAVFGHLRPDDLQPKDVGRFLDRPKGKIQANKQVAVLSAIYAKMVGRWYVAEKNPCRDVERNEEHRRRRYVTHEEFAAVRNLAKPRIRLAMDLALITGQRQGDLLSLLQSSCTEEGIKFTPAKVAKKVGKKILVQMSPALQEVVNRGRAMSPRVEIGGYLIRTRKGIRYTGEGFRACWQRTMRKALKLGVIQERFTFHDIRAKCVSDSASLEEAFERAGHTSMAMTRGTYDRGERKVKPLK